MERPRGALYLRRSRAHTLAGWIGIVFNLACVVTCARSVSSTRAEVRPGPGLFWAPRSPGSWPRTSTPASSTG